MTTHRLLRVIPEVMKTKDSLSNCSGVSNSGLSNQSRIIVPSTAFQVSGGQLLEHSGLTRLLLPLLLAGLCLHAGASDTDPNPAVASAAPQVQSAFAFPADRSIDDTFRRALVEEEANQNLGAAVQAYRQVIVGLDANRPMEATALFHLGECYRKQGKTKDALVQYRRVLIDFSDQATVVNLSRAALASLASSTPSVEGSALNSAIYRAQAALPDVKHAPSSSTSVPPPSGLVSWWRAEGNLDDAADNNPGIVSRVGYAPGKVGQAFDFDGQTSFIEIANNPNLNPTGSFTIECWIYPRADQASLLFSKWNGNGNNMCYNFQAGPNRGLGFAITDSAHEWDASFHSFFVAQVLTLNAWNHVAAVYDQSTGTRRIYVNGAQAGERTDPPITVVQGRAPVMIGAASATGDFFNGLIDEISFYSRALSAAEIEAIYGAGSAGKGTSTLAPNIPLRAWSEEKR